MAGSGTAAFGGVAGFAVAGSGTAAFGGVAGTFVGQVDSSLYLATQGAWLVPLFALLLGWLPRLAAAFVIGSGCLGLCVGLVCSCVALKAKGNALVNAWLRIHMATPGLVTT